MVAGTKQWDRPQVVGETWKTRFRLILRICILCRAMVKGEMVRSALQLSHKSAKIELFKMDVGDMKLVLDRMKEMKATINFDQTTFAMPGRLASKTALVTGGAQGLGRAICLAFAREGASVAIVDVKEKGMEETLKMMSTEHGNKHCSIVADVTITEQVKQCFRIAKEKLGQKCSILVNNAGVCINKPFLEITDEIFDKVINVNMKGVFLMSREFISFLKEDGNHPPASIVNMASISGKIGVRGQQAYGSSKAGVINMTKCIATEFAKDHIRCNAVMPGGMYTDLLLTFPQDLAEEERSKIPMGDFGQPTDVANGCLYLASDESCYVTGASLEITGGVYA